MAGGHAIRGAVSAAMVLIVLDALGRPGGAIQSGRFGTLIADANNLLQRALSPSVPAIPDRRAGAKGSSGPAFGITPQAAAEAAAAARNLPAVGVITNPGGLLGNSLQQYSSGGGLPAGLANNPALNPAG